VSLSGTIGRGAAAGVSSSPGSVPNLAEDSRLVTENWRVGKTIEDFCRPCKSVRAHTITLLDETGRPERVLCDTCGSQHNYRAVTRSAEERSGSLVTDSSEPEASQSGELETLLRRILREETGWTPTALADKWKGGELVLRPGKAGLQEKRIPIEVFFRKIVSIRNKLRVLEQQVHAADVPDELKLRLQGYITGCYGTLTSFNVLFANEDDRFHGTGKDE